MTQTPAPGGDGSPDHGSDEATPLAGVVRSEEQLAVTLPIRVRGGLRISKIVSIETVTQTVEVRREQLHVEELDADAPTLDTTQDLADYDLAEQEFDLILHEERVVVSTEVVPVERVRVRTRVITEQREVSDTVRREQVEIENIPAATQTTD